VNEYGETLMRSYAESSTPNINGTDYDDSLWGTTAPENMYGGAGHDEIVDFNTYEGDTFDLSAFNQADMTVIQDGADAIVHVANAGAICLLGVDASELNIDAYA